MFVRGAIGGVANEGVIAACLTSLMILLFLGSWRSTVIIAVSIPLSIMGAIVMLSAIGETLNIMTLGGLALAVGILVDDATVTIENINYHLEQGKPVDAVDPRRRQADRHAGLRLAALHLHRVRADVLPDRRRALPVRADGGSGDVRDDVVVHPVAHAGADHGELSAASRMSITHERAAAARAIRWCGSSAASRRGSSGCARAIATCCRWRSRTGRASSTGFLAFVAVSFLLVPFLGRNFFPAVDAGNILMHVRTQVGTRVEETAGQLADVQKAIRKIIPPEEIETVTDNIGMPISGINMTYNNTGVIGPQDGDIQIKLKEDHRPTAEHVQALREQLPRLFPGMTFAFLPADIVSQILNFGAPAPIDLQVRGANIDANFAYANKLLGRIRRIPGIADARIQQSPSAPTFNIDVDRTRAQYVGLTERDVTNSLVVNLAGSSQVAPTYYLNPDNGVSYSIVMQTPQYQIDSLSALQALPITATGNPQSPILGGIADVKRTNSSAVVSQYDIQTHGADFRHAAGTRSRRGRRRHQDAARRHREGCAEGLVRGAARPGADHELGLLRPAVRAARRGGADLSADRRELPVLVRSRS